jgi:3-isopropylmalate/(R)-2-methylmalate dehydratase small subunit
MKFGIDVIAQHCLEAVRPEFRQGRAARRRDRGRRELRHRLVARAGAGVLVHLGVACGDRAIVRGLYFRNAFNVGLLLLTCPRAARSTKTAR